MESLDSTPFVSVVIINWNRKEILKEALTRLGRQTYQHFEIIVADNDSTDGAPEMVENEFSHIKLIRLHENMGIKGYNIAFEHSSGKFIVILDNDSFLEDEGIAKIIKKFQTYPRLGALGCKVYNYYSGKVHHWHPKVRDENGSDEGFDSPLFNGCAGAARRSVLEEVGFYPEEFFLYENERDLCTRIINAGYDVKYFTDIAGFHMVSDEARSSERLIFYATRNQIWYFWKYLPINIAVWKTIKITIFNTFAALKNMEVKTYFKPIASALEGLPNILKQRNPVKKEYLSKVLY
jgi:GT2 family glycosyltransferase